MLTSNQLRILRALADSPAPLPSREIMRLAGLFNTEMQTSCARLLSLGYVSRKLLRRKQQSGDSWGLKPLAYWSLTLEGRSLLLGAACVTERAEP